MLETEHGLQKTGKERESDRWAILGGALNYAALSSCVLLYLPAPLYLDILVINPNITSHAFNVMFVVLSCHLVDVQGSLP